MTIKRNVQLPRSNKKGVKPRADELDYGNLAVNYAAGDEFLSTKNSNNEVVVFPSKNYLEKHPFSSLTIDNLAVNSGASIKGNTTVDGGLKVSGDTYLGGTTYVKSGNTLVEIKNFITETANADANNYVTDGIAKNNKITLKRNGLADTTIAGVVTTDKIAEEVKSASNWKAGQGNGAVLLKNSNGSAAGEFSVSEGKGNTARGDYSHAEGSGTTASGNFSHAEGSGTTASGNCSHAEGSYTTASGDYSHAECQYTKASGSCSHAEGYMTTASGEESHAEGDTTTASGDSSHAEGYRTKASGNFSHAEGEYTTASGYCSHAEGNSTIASGDSSHAEGAYTEASGSRSHAEGYYTTASGNFSHAEGSNTIAMNEAEHACGSYNRSVLGSGQVFSVGAGTSDNNRVNSFYVKNDGTIGSDLDMSISGKSKITLSTASDKLIMSGGTLTTNCTMTTGAHFTTSDERLKTNIIDVTEDEIEKAKKVDLKSFELKRDGKKHFGVVAQEVETAGLSELVNTDSEGMKSVDYTSLLILKIAELEKEIKDLKNQINKK